MMFCTPSFSSNQISTQPRFNGRSYIHSILLTSEGLPSVRSTSFFDAPRIDDSLSRNMTDPRHHEQDLQIGATAVATNVRASTIRSAARGLRAAVMFSIVPPALHSFPPLRKEARTERRWCFRNVARCPHPRLRFLEPGRVR